MVEASQALSLRLYNAATEASSSLQRRGSKRIVTLHTRCYGDLGKRYEAIEASDGAVVKCKRAYLRAYS